jgi:toxin ParE1/3/4
MFYQIIIRPEAQVDISESFQWYQEKCNGLGTEFLTCVDSLFNILKENPEIYQQIYKNVRRALTFRFPYEIFYIIEEYRIIVLAVFHAKRNPELLIERVSGNSMNGGS